MVNKELWNETIAIIKTLPSYDDFHYYECIEKMFTALGDDEAEALEFMKELSKKDKVYLSSTDKEILDKFPSSEMSQFIQDEVVAPMRIHQSLNM